ncbi:sensor histidine kinase [Kamptonema formosum]|uniref:sensor histidine kinase n=1 Tax=Kamptonema formosum TaxID=331992 RepID=UPI0009E43D55|nr:HAMP domain-containing sensor histidine kinase [Oscillatoria sp. PCC 10802]
MRNGSVTLEALSSGAGEEQELRNRFIQTALEETARLSRLIQDLLELGRLEAGVLPLQEQPVSLQQLLNRCVLAMESRMRAASPGFELDVPDVEFKGDPERLLQAFLNVLDNAIKYSAPDSEVFVSGSVGGGFVAVQIQDWGAGISEADFPHLFEQFYTADRSRKGSGTGLGLAIAQPIVEAHGGKIAASSSARKGATSTIRLPLTPPARPAAGNS